MPTPEQASPPKKVFARIAKLAHTPPYLTSEELHIAPLYEHIVEESEQGVWLADAENYTMYVNAKMAQMLGYDRHEMLGQSIWDYMDVESRRIVEEVIPGRLDGERGQYDLQLLHRDGHPFWAIISATPLFDSRKHFVGSLAMLTDITERKKAKQAQGLLAAIVMSPEHAIIGRDNEGTILTWNPGAEKLYGYTAAEVVGRSILMLVPPERQQEVYASLRRVAEGTETLHQDTIRLHKNGRHLSVTIHVAPIRNECGEVTGASMIVHSLEAEKLAEGKLAETSRRVEHILNSITDAFISCDSEWRITYINHHAHDYLAPLNAASKQPFVGRSIAEIYPRFRRSVLFRKFSQIKEQQMPLRFEAYLAARQTWLEVHLYPLRDGLAMYFTDVTERKQTAGELAAHRERLELAQTAGHIGAFEWSVETGQMIWTAEMARLYGRPDVATTNWQDWLNFVHPKDRQLLERTLLEAIDTATAIESEFRVLWPDGSCRWLNLRAKIFCNRRRRPVRIVGVNVDISERREAEQMVRYQALHDALTGLPNRVYLQERLQDELVWSKKVGKQIAVLFLDLDQFKYINDSLGHQVGDLLLCAVAERLKASVKHHDIVARFGGDEFLIVLTEVHNRTQIKEIAQRVLQAFKPIFQLQGWDVHMNTSIGIALFPDDSDSPEQLIKQADTALYRAKEQGRNTFRFYTEQMNMVANERLDMEQSLRQAIDQQAFVLHFEPMWDPKTGLIQGVEALLRWRHPQRGLLLPGAFIPLAEDTGLIIEMGQWVLRAACLELKRWHKAGLSNILLSVNLSARQFADPDLIGQISRTLKEMDVMPSQVQLEVTESVAMQDPQKSIARLMQLREIGVRIAIDDFGIGQSSLSYLKELPADSIKIDRSFIDHCTTDSRDAAILSAMINLAQTLGLEVTAEGVESEEQLLFLADRKCNLVQGYFLCKPFQSEQFMAILAKNRQSIALV